MEAIDYEKRIIAFVDILGWKRAINDKSASEIYSIMAPIIQMADVYNNQARTKIEEQAKENNGKVNPLFMSIQLAIFSDCLAYSMPSDIGSRVYDKVAFIIREFLRKGYLVRGGISEGDLYHNDQIVFGPGLVKAHEIESKRASFPRVLIDESVINMTGRDNDLPIMSDHIGNCIVDPFPVMIKNLDSNDMKNFLENNFYLIDIVENVLQGIKGSSSNPSIKDKWIFQAKICAHSLEKFNNATADIVSRLKDEIEYQAAM